MSKDDSTSPGFVSGEGMPLKLHLLSMVEIFCDLSEEEIEEVGGMVNMITCKRGHLFYRPEEQAEVLFLLKKGEVQVYSITAEGKRLIIETIGPGTFFGEMLLTAQSMHHAFAEATEDSLLCVLSRSDLERLLVRKPTLALRVIDSLSRQLQETRTMLEDVTFRSATARVCRLLLKMARHTLDLSGLSHQELADATGLYRETVTNVLNRLRSQGIVELGRRKIVILNRVGLEEAAQT